VADALVVIGRVGRAHGLRGAVRAVPIGATLGSLAPEASVTLRGPGRVDRRVVVAQVQGTSTQPILSFEGIVGRTSAEALRGVEILIPSQSLASLDDDDTFYVRDLIGCEVRCEGRMLGVVTDVIAGPANDVLELAGELGPLLLPFTLDAIPEMDLAARVLTLRPGLLGDETV
jgi:16S rRNA processing protein RimM